VVDRSVRLVQHQLELSGIHLQLHLAPDLPLVQCDASQIEQVLLALVMNAIDAMPQGGNLWLTTAFCKDDANVNVQIIVRDDGAGISPEILPRLFEPFLTTKEIGRGVGLGLAISRSILERHSGNIEVQSEVGRGTTFTVTLPWYPEKGYPEKDQPKKCHPENDSLKVLENDPRKRAENDSPVLAGEASVNGR
jgi:two-component system NtrC family sensor kinase